jgi:hypothetical protein
MAVMVVTVVLAAFPAAAEEGATALAISRQHPGLMSPREFKGGMAATVLR